MSSNAMIRPVALAASNTMPLLNTRRLPRVCSWRGRKRFCTKIEASIGKPKMPYSQPE